MENTVKQTGLLEKTGVFDEDLENRYELHLTYNGIKGKSVLLISTNPASNSIQIFDNTTNYLVNNLGAMGFSDITVWNLFSKICVKLHPAEIKDNQRNLEYLKEILGRKYDVIIIAWGSTFKGNKSVERAKQETFKLLKPYAKVVYEIVDDEGKYKDLSFIHPLFAGQRFSGHWQLKKIELPKNVK